MKKCRFCGTELDESAVFCAVCGRRCEETPQEDIICPRCGTQNRKGDRFCRGCGAELLVQYTSQAEWGAANENLTEANQEDFNQDDGKAKKKYLIPAIAGGILLLAVAVGGTLLAFRGKWQGVGKFGLEQDTFAGVERELFDLSQAKLEENYRQPEGMGIIDLGARNHQPAARDTAALWDKGLFYYLEDIGGENDNHIAECLLVRMELVRTDNGKTMEYEVYRDKETGQIQKIVSIETKEDGRLELSDYYYQDGTPNFVFRRDDSIYTPSYATIDKTGERYYFSADQMVKWRWIYEPSVVNQWILEPEDTWYTQWGYMEISDGDRIQYDEKENQILNEAYNTYDAVLANEPAAVIQGRVTDEDGQPLEDVEVGIGRIENGERKKPEIKLKTDREGRYAWKVTEGEEKAEYFLIFNKEGRVSSLMQVPDIGIGYQMMQTAQDDMVLLKEKEDEEASVIFYTYQVKEQSVDDVLARGFSEGGSEEELPVLSEAFVAVYPGVNCLFGTPVAEGKTSEQGMLSMELPIGIYTAVIEKEGILPSRKVFLAGGKDKKQVIYAMTEGAGAKEGEGSSEIWNILLSWDASDTESLDLDSSLFTPDKAEKGDRNCINTLNRDDGKGAQLLYDGEGNNACELITLTAPERGSYKYYVTDYTGIQAGNMDSRKMADSNAKVTVFCNGIPVKTFSVPDNPGVVWEVFELRNQGIVPIQEVYERAEGKSWWLEDKKLARLSERGVRAGWIQSDGEWLYFANPSDGKLYYCRKDGSGLTKFSDDGPIDGEIVLAEDQIYYLTYDENSKLNIVRVKNDGSGRTVVQENIQTTGVELWSTGVSLLGYADGMLYYNNSSYFLEGSSVIPVDGGEVDTSIWSLAENDINGKNPHYKYGNHPDKTVVVGNYLYYVEPHFPDGDESGIHYEMDFCRKNLVTGEEECLIHEISWDTGSWRIYKGWLYYTEHETYAYMEPEVIKRTRIAGPGSFTEHEILAEDGTGGVYGGDSPCGQYSLEFCGDKCYYQGNDNQMHVMNLDGSDNRVLPFSVDMEFENSWCESYCRGRVFSLDGEIYRVDDGVVMVSGKNGENVHPLFDVTLLWADLSRSAYAYFLEHYLPAYGPGGEKVAASSFACQDINGDGICELFLFYQDWMYSGSGMSTDYYTYNGTVQCIWNDSICDEVRINKEAQEIIQILWTRDNYCIVRYRFDGSVIEDKNFEFDSWDPGRDESAYEAYFAAYAEPYPILNHVENTPENRQRYILDGVETGWVSE